MVAGGVPGGRVKRGRLGGPYARAAQEAVRRLRRLELPAGSIPVVIIGR